MLASSVVVDKRPPRRMPSAWAIAQYWDADHGDKPALDFPENPCWWIGLGEPYCFACGWLAPVEDGLGADSWKAAESYLDRTHLVDRWQGGLDGPQNLVMLCHRCHEDMPSFGHGEGEDALAWVRRHEDYSSRVARELETMPPGRLKTLLRRFWLRVLADDLPGWEVAKLSNTQLRDHVRQTRLWAGAQVDTWVEERAQRQLDEVEQERRRDTNSDPRVSAACPALVVGSSCRVPAAATTGEPASPADVPLLAGPQPEGRALRTRFVPASRDDAPGPPDPDRLRRARLPAAPGGPAGPVLLRAVPEGRPPRPCASRAPAIGAPESGHHQRARAQPVLIPSGSRPTPRRSGASWRPRPPATSPATLSASASPRRPTPTSIAAGRGGSPGGPSHDLQAAEPAPAAPLALAGQVAAARPRRGAVTSRRAQRRVLERATVATRPAAPSRELERRGVATLEPITATAIMAMTAETPGTLARRLEVERQQAAIQAEILERPEARHLAGWGVTAVRHATEVQVPPELRRDLVVGAGQPFECYQRALWFVLRHADVPGVRLRHGFVVEGEPARAWSHGWAEVGGTVFDPTPGRYFRRASWYEALRAVPLVTYPPEQAAARCQEEGPPPRSVRSSARRRLQPGPRPRRSWLAGRCTTSSSSNGARSPQARARSPDKAGPPA